MLLDIVMLIGGLALILVGATALTDGSSALAKRWGVSDLVIGLTVVAFGTSAPELTISVISAIHGNPGLAVGNVVGSNIFNILVIIGLVALVHPVKVDKTLLNNELPMVMLSSATLLTIGCGGILGVPGPPSVSRVDGILLLLYFLIFLRYTFSKVQKNDGGEPTVEAEAAGEIKKFPLWKSALWIAGGLAGLIYGGDIFVNGVSGLAKSFGVSDAIIGLTVVAAGTSLPELATSVLAACKGKTGIALGNVIGSCIFNIFMVLGASATIFPLPFGEIGITDLLVLMGASVLFWIFGHLFKVRTITRAEGAVMCIIYVAYTAWLLSNA